MKNLSLEREDLIKLRSKKKYEKILGVREDAPEEKINTAFLSSRKRFQGDKKALLIINEAYGVLTDEKKRKELLLQRWLKKKFSMWEEDTRTQIMKEIKRNPQIENYSLSELQNFLRSGRAIETILGILGIEPVEGPITRDEQREGCELQFRSTTGEILRINVPSRVRDGEIIMVEDAIIKIRVIPRDAHEILDKFAHEFIRRLNLPFQIMESDLITKMLNEKSAIEYVRGRIKEGWSDERIIDAMISDLIKQVPRQKPAEQKGRSSAGIIVFIIIVIIILYYFLR